MTTDIDFAKICTQLQIQRNQFADAHATAAARAEALAEECEQIRQSMGRQLAEIGKLEAKIADLEKPKPEMLLVTHNNYDDIPF